jgi:PAS domain-containing protein
MGKNFLKLNILDENGLARAAGLLKDNIKGKSTGPDELDLISKDGRHIPIEINTSVIQQGSKKVVLAFARDITARRQMEEEVQKLASVVRYSSELVNISETDGKMIFLNAAGAKCGQIRRS